jgi:hypothetical protein
MRRLLLILLVLGCAREPAPAIARHDAIAQPASSSVDSLASPSPVSSTGEASRNIFAYRERPVVAAVEHRLPPASDDRLKPVLQQSIPIPQPPQAPPFGYRCVGTFGTDAHRFAVFTNGDGVINVSVGDVVGKSEFVLREIGVESVTVATNTFTHRIEIGR